MIDDLLPPPQLIEELGYEALLAEVMSDIQTRLDAAGIAYDVGALETDPVKIVAEAMAYRETLYVQKLNEKYASYLIDYTFGAALDHLAKFYDCYRMVDEDDARLQRRTKLEIIGRSAAGPVERIMAMAMASDIRVKDARVWREGRDPTLCVAILSSDNEGNASTELLDVVSAALIAKQVTSDRFVVKSAVTKIVDLKLLVRLSSTAAMQTLEDLESRLREAWSKADVLGLDLNHAWLTSVIMGGDITDIEVLEPTGRIAADPNEAIAFGEITIEFEGRGR